MTKLAYQTLRPTKQQTIYYTPPSSAESLLQNLLDSSIILSEEWETVPQDRKNALLADADGSALLSRLVQHGMLTQFQADRISAGRQFGLILGNYRVLDHIGTGGMGIVFTAEHVLMRRQVAIKVLEPSRGQDQRVLSRFLGEMRAVARLRHPNIVGALDAGKVPNPDADTPPLYYLVMEYVAGENLEAYVEKHGPLAPPFACDLMYQLAGALCEAQKHELVHRDLKPSNVMVTPENQAKLLDFGLVHHFRNKMTAPSIALGTIDYMAPEQAQDAGAVDIRADIYGLGGILYWCLTGQRPFAPEGGLGQALLQRLTLTAPCVRALRPGIPADLDAVVARMMARNPNDRYPTPQAVIRALAPFLKSELREQLALTTNASLLPSLRLGNAPGPNVHRILVADDAADIRQLCQRVLKAEGIHCDLAADGNEALEAVGAMPYDLLLLDVDMPGRSGPEVCKLLREKPPCANLKIVMFSGRSSADELAEMMLAGADDYLSKPFSLTQIQSRVQAALRLKDAQDRSDLLNRHLLVVNHELEGTLGDRDHEQVRARNAMVLALAQCVEYRDGETRQHLLRLQRYSRTLAEESAKLPSFANQIDRNFIDMLECCVPLHDLGKIRLPDHILLKPDKLTPDERIQVQAHTVIGADTLQEVAQQHGYLLAFLQTAIDIARHHHERYDGTGYPDRLAGNTIPLAARLVTIGDVYDALRSRRVYKPALSHTAALQVMVENSAGQFDPALMQVFLGCATQFERIFRELPD